MRRIEKRGVGHKINDRHLFAIISRNGGCNPDGPKVAKFLVGKFRPA